MYAPLRYDPVAKFEVRDPQYGDRTLTSRGEYVAVLDPEFVKWGRLLGIESSKCKNLAREANKPGAFADEKRLVQYLNPNASEVFGPALPGVASVWLRPHSRKISKQQP